ncbi:MAG: 5-oxoprolinase/urea amidolyase family protein [Aquabacterium sp.]|uniref:5-oxoprolinase/urea amidolyase family protein n=1 Tax=Aquabacterium sp. TaxID=1872578 RepID=UPI0025C6919E|nr:5-oxoprolinase/urea amidolyase family protein [Aquabacterium sp.]MBI5924000.1 5-oxoprolinase/urea amidolyase family protein [Aquabacterium sp.]
MTDTTFSNQGFDTVLIANRGAIACRVIRTLRKMGLRSVAVYSEADADARHVAMADASVCIGPAPAAQSYLDVDRILAAAKATGAGAIHPGYGFLSENPGFAQACEDAGIAFIGPTPDQMRAFGLKHTARELAQQHQVPLLPGSDLLRDAADARQQASRIGYPVMLKSTAGGGGIGMRLVRNEAELAAAYEAVARLASANFKDAGLFLEKFVERARHIEVQLFGDGRGQVVALGERDCSAQRRNQKVIEETPAPGLSAATREALLDAAVRLGQAVSYRSAGTVEYVLDADTGAFYFLEVNTRLQVEHGVTEQVTGIDLVEWMVKLARGDQWALQAPEPKGASIQVRLYAEDPARQFQPSAGVLTEVRFPDDARVDGWVERGTDVPAFYDPMLAKLIVTADTREQAVRKLQDALAATRLSGIETNLRYLRAVTASPVFAQGQVVTLTLGDFQWQPRAIEVLDGGVQTTVQDWPGRIGYWNVGVPPCGPMDDLHLRLANKLIGNGEGAAALECTVGGPALRFHADMVIALAGAPMPVTLDGVRLPCDHAYNRALAVKAGSTLKLGTAPLAEGGARTYLAVQGGLDVPLYLGSRSTFTLGQFGGHAGRALRTGDMLHADATPEGAPSFAAVCSPTPHPDHALPQDLAPTLTRHWDIGVMYGPHGAPDFFTPPDIDIFFSTDYQVHYNSSRTGVRLIGPKPQWARTDGGEAGLHPSNIHDNAYAIGAIDFTGDMPVILGPDGPSLGGFVCPAVVVGAERWKLGQLKACDTVRFHALTLEQAIAMQAAQDALINAVGTSSDERPSAGPSTSATTNATTSASTSPSTRKPQALPGCPTLPQGVPASEVATRLSPIVEERPADVHEPEARPARVIRQAGDRYILVEYGPLHLDLTLRFRVHAVMTALQALRDQGQLTGIVDMTPGIRSLQIHFEPGALPRARLLAALNEAEASLAGTDDLVVPTRTVWLPLSWDDSATRLAIEKYMQSVRPDAPWCPSNIEFIRRINGLGSIEDVKRIVFDAGYLVMGLGDVYLGAPVATPLDPRHRLVTTKYNPARTWTPENAVGIGGAYMCVYGMEGPGGYQFVGRTVQMWNRWRDAGCGAMDFEQGKPWLLRFFDQIRFYPVSEAELAQMRRDFPAGRLKLKIEEGQFSLKQYQGFLAQQADSIAAFKQTQQAAFDAERERWKASGQDGSLSEPDHAPAADADAVPEGAHAVGSPVPGSVWKVLVTEGEQVSEGQTLAVVESMKMEFPVLAPSSGKVIQVRCREGGAVSAGQHVMVLAA